MLYYMYDTQVFLITKVVSKDQLGLLEVVIVPQEFSKICNG